MRNAETIIKEYLEQGYGIQGLRVLAESRSEPLCSEMLAILRTMEEAESLDVACEAAADAEDVIFFVADDEDSVAGETGIDFDLMAETSVNSPSSADHHASDPTPPASLEESVADILIGETQGSEVVKFSPGSVATEMQQVGEESVWSRRWHADGTDQPIAEEPTSEPDAIAQGSEGESCNQINDKAAHVDVPHLQSVDDAAPELFETIAAQSDISSDYLPGSVVIPRDEFSARMEAEADEKSAILHDTGPEQSPDAMEDRVSTSVTEAAPPVADTAPGVELSCPPSIDAAPLAHADDTDKKEGRKERRRRERAEKKKLKARRRQQQDDTTAAASLPEIVLTRAEGTETLIPEAGANDSTAPDATELKETPAAELEKTCGWESASGESHESALDKAMSTASPSTDGVTEDEAMDESDQQTLLLPSIGLDLRSDAYRLLNEESGIDSEELNDYAPDDESIPQGNVILFRTHFVEFASSDDAEATTEEPASQPLHMLPFQEEAMEPAVMPESAVASDLPAVAEMPAPAMSPMDQLGLIRALSGLPETGAPENAVEPGEHIILSLPDETTQEDMLEMARLEKEELEREYQERLDEFARRLLELQATVAAGETLARQRAKEIAAKEDELEAIRQRVLQKEKEQEESANKLEELRQAAAQKQAKLDEFQEMLGEHERLYREFEDLRKAYNEVVVEVMPNLQNERDDLALTVERQCESEANLHSALGSARRRLAVGYTLGAAACAMFVALPFLNWMRSGSDARDLAMGVQQTGELREMLDKAEMRNLEHEKKIFELERKASLQLAEIEEKNRELSTLSDRRAMEMAMARGGSTGNGTPIRVSDMALSGPNDADGLLRYNDVRDPAGRIEMTLRDNRARQQDDGQPSTGNERVAVNSRTRTQSAQPTLRPPEQSGTNVRASQNTRAKPDEVMAKVKTGEGVAQVVYRVLGTRDPEVINWVIRENNIKKDRRGNPRIYPDQQLRLPKSGRTSQSASASRR